MNMRTFVGLALLCGAQIATAGTVCCTDDKGRMICDDGVPAACRGRAYREMSAQGNVIRSVDAPLTPEQKAKRETEIAQKKLEEKRLAERDKQDRILQANYNSVRDIDNARIRILNDQDKNLQLLQTKLDEAQKRKKQLDSETEFYKKKVLPPALKGQIADNATQMKLHQTALENKKQEIETLRNKFEEDKKRFIELSGSKR